MGNHIHSVSFQIDKDELLLDILVLRAVIESSGSKRIDGAWEIYR